MNLYEAATRAPESFEHVARALGTGFSSALRERVAQRRRDMLDGWLRSQPRDTLDIAGWLANEGQEAGWSILALATEFIEPNVRHLGYEWRIAALVQTVIRGVARVETPWLWVELIAQLPGRKRTIAQDVDRAGLAFGDRALPAIDHALRTWPAFPHRGLLARRLQRSGRVDAALAVRWLADPALRAIGKEWLTPGVAAHEAVLRAALDDASPGTREAIVGLLRRVDAKMALDGKTEETDDAELQSRLRADPADTETSLVWVDLLGVQGDPRGEHVALEHAIASAEPERALELSRAQAEVCHAHRKGIWNRPGGFPFREKYRGRDVVGFQSDWDHKVRGKVENIFGRVQAFANRVTDAYGPIEIQLGRARELDHVEPSQPETPLEEQLIAALGDAAVYAGDVRFVLRTGNTPLADPDALRGLCIANPELTVIYRFQLAWPGTRVPLPHQEGPHYADGVPLVSKLAMHFARRELALLLKFPYETLADDHVAALYEATCSTLGRVLTATRFFTATASADGKRMVQRLAEYRGEPG